MWAYELKFKVLILWFHQLFQVMLFAVTMESCFKCGVLLAVEHLFITAAVLVSV